jgi:hypothetical protein
MLEILYNNLLRSYAVITIKCAMTIWHCVPYHLDVIRIFTNIQTDHPRKTQVMSYIKTVHDWHVSVAMGHPLEAFQHCICWVTFRWPMWVKTCQGPWLVHHKLKILSEWNPICSLFIFSLSFIFALFHLLSVYFHLISFSQTVIDILLFNRTCLLSTKYCHLMNLVIYFRVRQDDLVPLVFLDSRGREVIQENYHLAWR